MFLSTHGNEIWIVEQYNHSHQAGEVASFWGNKEFSAPSESLVTAVKEHDLGWVELDKEILFNKETGKPINFIDIDLKQHVQLYSNGYKQMVEKDPYAGLLIGKHWLGLYTSRYGYDPTFTYQIPAELKSFMRNLIIETEKEFVNIKMNYWEPNEKRSRFEDKIWMDYEFLQVMDRMSQLVSIHTPQDNVAVVLGPVRQSLDSEGIYITVQQPGNGTVIVDPFPFEDEFETSVKVRRIADRRYASHAELKEVINQTPYEIIEWKIISR